MSQNTQQIIEETFTQHRGRVMAHLIGSLGDFDLAEDVMQEAFVTALEKWEHDGIPANPGGWITVTARRKALDRLRHLKMRDRKLPDLLPENEPAPDTLDMDSIPDERLKLIFTCCHPALNLDAQVALTLHTLGGLTTEETARAFLVPVPTMAQRLVRVKRKIRDAGIPYRMPPPHLIDERLDAVLTVLYLIFNEGYSASQGDALIRHDLCREAIRLAQVLNALMVDDANLNESPEALGLLALMLLHHSRRDARQDADGLLITLEDQDRSRWHRQDIAEGIATLDRALSHRQTAGKYQLQAAISALHAQAPRPQDTDWQQIALLYGELLRLHPTPVVALNQAVAVGMAHGFEHGLALVERLGKDHDLSAYVPYHAARADMLRRMHRHDDARAAYQTAHDLTQNAVERAFFMRRLTELG